MLVTNTMEATASTTDSCQVSEPVTATQETPGPSPLTPPQHRPCTGNHLKSKNRLFFPLSDSAVAYIAALIINRIIKTRKTHH